MNDHPQRELAPLAALGSLDGESLLEWNEHARGCETCRAELAAFEALVGSMGMASGSRRLSPQLRRRVMAAAGAGSAPSRSARAPWVLASAASLAALGLAGAAVSARIHRQGEQAALTRLMSAPSTRTVALAGLPAAPGAQARMVWNAEQQRGMLMVSGLQPAPAGKAYELWVIADGKPVAAGVFQTGPRGEAVFQMRWVEDAAGVRTFAVTVEPAGGVTAPTGPMVLAGAVS